MSTPRPESERAFRPDPQQGVFETMLVAGGRPVELDAHLERMAASLRALFELELPDDAGDLAVEKAAGLGLGRLRLTAVPRRGEIELAAQAEAVEASSVFALAARSVALRSVVLPGGLGPHKWADRAFLEDVEAAMSADDPAKASGAPAGDAAPLAPLPLLVDDDGTVLEASRANVFAVLDGALATPPLDGRILPGIARQALIEVARETGHEVREEPLAVAALTAADGVFLTGSVRGVEPAGSLDGSALGSTDATTLLAAALRRRWLTR